MSEILTREEYEDALDLVEDSMSDEPSSWREYGAYKELHGEPRARLLAHDAALRADLDKAKAALREIKTLTSFPGTLDRIYENARAALARIDPTDNAQSEEGEGEKNG